jgi:hypothetical protein
MDNLWARNVPWRVYGTSVSHVILHDDQHVYTRQGEPLRKAAYLKGLED